MAIEIKEEWYPMPVQLGPPLPRSMQIYWPWVKPPAPPEIPEIPEIPLPPPPGVPPPAKYRLYVYTVGKGTVTPTDGEYPAGATVTLTARPGYGAAFDRWAGDAAGTSPIVSITMDRSKSATAYFKAITPPPYEEEPPPEEIPPVPPPPYEEEPPPEEIPLPEPEPEPEPVEFNVFARKKMYPTIDPYTVCETWVDVTNNSAGPGVQILHVWDSVGNVDSEIEITLNPGETHTWHRVQWIDFSRISSYKVEAETGYFDTQDRWVRSDYSKVIFP